MKFFFFIFIFILISNCSNQKTVLICGNHVCVNKAEAEQYFEENLSLEVKVFDKKNKNELNLIELNMNKDVRGKKTVNIHKKKALNKDLKTLSNKEIVKIKKKIKNKNKKKKITKKVEKKAITKNVIKQKNMNKNQKNNIDVCDIIEKCSIDEITKFLLKHGKNKDFPDITTRQ